VFEQASSQSSIGLFTLYNISAQLRSQIKRDWQSSLQNILFELQIELIACNFLDELARVDRVELHSEVQFEDVFVLLQLSREASVRVEPVLCEKIACSGLIYCVAFIAASRSSYRLSFEIQVPESEVRCLEEIEPREDNLEQ
jgi:hypothetical protein